MYLRNPLRLCKIISTLSFIILSAIFQREKNHSYLIISFLKVCESVSLANGEVNYNQSPVSNGIYPLNTIASFTCNNGYYLVGSKSSTCHAPNSWNNDIPTCSKGNKRNEVTCTKFQLSIYFLEPSGESS